MVLEMENFGYLYSVAIVAGGIVGYVKKGNEKAPQPDYPDNVISVHSTCSTRSSFVVTLPCLTICIFLFRNHQPLL